MQVRSPGLCRQVMSEWYTSSIGLLLWHQELIRLALADQAFTTAPWLLSRLLSESAASAISGYRRSSVCHRLPHGPVARERGVPGADEGTRTLNICLGKAALYH